MKINVKKKVDNNVAIENNGIIFHDFFLDKETFLSLYKEYYLEKKINIDYTINELLIFLNSYNKNTVNAAMSKQFQILWESFQSVVLLNKNPLQLLVVYRGDGSGKHSEYSTIIDQSAVEEAVNTKRGYRYGINSGNQLILDSMAIIKARNVEEFLQIHMSGLLNQLYTSLDPNQAKALHIYHSDILNHIYTTSNKAKRQHLTGEKWYKVIYGNAGFAQWQGNAYEAFFNHMANHEPALFNYLSTHGQTMAVNLNVQSQKNSVFIEEGGNQFNLGNFPRLMMGQINSIPWFAGGDIVIINNKLEVIYNIQLKTTTRNIQSVFEEKISELRNFLIKFTDLTSVDEKANLLFNTFHNTIANSNIVNNLEKDAIDEAIKVIKNSLH